MRSMIRSLVLVVAVAAAMALPASADVGLEGCTLGPADSCEYVAAHPGNIAAVGDWTVQVWWEGVCGAGPADYTRSSAPHTAYPASPDGDNNAPGGLAGTWEGTVAVGGCARVTTGDGVALVGNVFAEV